MKRDRGFRIPEARDRAIRWPARRGEQRQPVAVWDPDAAAWLVTGSATAYGDPIALVHQYGNDWLAVTIEPLPEAAP